MFPTFDAHDAMDKIRLLSAPGASAGAIASGEAGQARPGAPPRRAHVPCVPLARIAPTRASQSLAADRPLDGEAQEVI
jgi:hypothetical protein